MKPKHSAPSKARKPDAFIPFARPVLGREEEESVLAVLRSGWLTTGKEAENFEEEFAAFLGDSKAGETAKAENTGGTEDTAGIEGCHAIAAIAVSSATAGLHLGIHALGYRPGHIIALSPYTFAASINSILYNRLQPLLVDTVPGGYHLDPDNVEKAFKRIKVRRKLRGVMPVHFAGREYGGEALSDICQQRGLDMIEDAAHSFPAKNSSGSYQGTRGRFAVFSFYANKTITTGEGGMVVTADPDLAANIRIMRSHGISRDAFSRYTHDADAWASRHRRHRRHCRHQPAHDDQPALWHYDIVAPGFKYNIPDILACIGRVQLRKAHQLMEARRSIAERYMEAFADRGWCSPPCGTEGSRTSPAGTEGSRGAGMNAEMHSWHIYSLRLNLTALRITRDAFINELSRCGIGSSVHFIPLHLMTYYKHYLGHRPEDFPNALHSYMSTISLPIYSSLEDDDVERVIAAVLKIGDAHYRGSSYSML